MGIRFRCPSCQHGLNVKNYLAGRRGICPKCKNRLTIPQQSVVASPSASTHASATNGKSSARKPAFRDSASTSRSANIQNAAKTFESLDLKQTIQPASPNSQELELNSKRPAPDWDDAHDADARNAKLTRSDASNKASRQPVSERPATQQPVTQQLATEIINSATGEASNFQNHPPNESAPHHNGHVDQASAASPSTRPSDGSSSKSLATAQEMPNEPSSPFDDLAFEDLAPSSFVLDRPEHAPADKPTGHYDWIAEAPQAVWYVRHHNGAQYGPAVGPQMRTWVGEGRVTVGCHVWREGWANWRAAGDVFPQIKPQPHQPLSAPQATVRQATLRQPEEVTPTAPRATEEPVQHTRSKNRWLFPALLLFLAVLASILGVGIYQFAFSSSNNDGPPTKPGEIVDPFAENNNSE